MYAWTKDKNKILLFHKTRSDVMQTKQKFKFWLSSARISIKDIKIKI